MIKTNNLTIKYDTTVACNNINLNITPGEKVAIIGQSGCGKTSLIHAVAGLIKPSSGVAKVLGQEVLSIRQGTSIILQKDGLFPWKNVADNVMLALINEKMTKEEKLKRTVKILDELNILEYKDKYLNQLSGGQRQRVAIARALVRSPDLLLMDEPSGSLDMITKEKFQDSLHELYNHHHMTVITVTHDIEEAVCLGQRILVMDKGEIITEVVNPLFEKENVRESIEFYELCLKVRRVMKS